MRARILVALVLGATACNAPPALEMSRSESQAIVGGATDSGDLAVVLLIAYAPGKDPFKGDPSVKSCTATLVSPHALVTAAHCVGGEFPSGGSGYTYWIYGGTSVTADPSPKLVEVKSV